MTCAVLSIGTELTRGELVNSNAAWLSAGLTDLGFEVVEHDVVDDDRATHHRGARAPRVVRAGHRVHRRPRPDHRRPHDRGRRGCARRRPRARRGLARSHPPSLRASRPPDVRLQREAGRFSRGRDTSSPNPIGTAPGFEVKLHERARVLHAGRPARDEAHVRRAGRPAHPRHRAERQPPDPPSHVRRSPRAWSARSSPASRTPSPA